MIVSPPFQYFRGWKSGGGGGNNVRGGYISVPDVVGIPHFNSLTLMDKSYFYQTLNPTLTSTSVTYQGHKTTIINLYWVG